MSSMSNNEERADFRYNGRLVFNGLRETEIRSGDPAEIKEALLDGLPRFERGNPHSKNEGFDKIQLSDLANSQEYILESDLGELAENLIDEKLVWESYDDSLEFVDEEGDPVSAWLRQTNESYMYWDYPNHMIIQGSQDKVEEAERRINSALGEDVHVADVKFEPDFLLWLLYKHEYPREELPGPIKSRKLESSEVSGDNDGYGHTGRVEESRNIGESLPIILAVLQKMDFEMIEGIFGVNGHNVTVEIKSSGRIHVKVAGAIDEAESKLKRALVAVFFASEFLRLHGSWKSLPDQEKYPPFEFFDDLAATAAANNVEVNFDMDELIEEYEDKRGEIANPSELDHIGNT